ncbi:MAG: N-acetylmuramoyl-L-alanine amidase [Saprospiraceae bacterium]|nr:N-acetylmuramoyl-L-alanine amidase [Saprospiraceae bacterium]
MKKLTLHIIYLVLIPFIIYGKEPNNLNVKYLQIKAKKGQGVLSLMREFNLTPYSCSLDEFYKINGLKKSDGLIEGKSYFLPIIITKFDGKSIRSSLNIKDYDLAKSIENFNDINKEARKADFRKNKVLWVPPYQSCNASTDIAKQANIKEVKNISEKTKSISRELVADNKIDDIVHADNTKIETLSPVLKRVSNTKINFDLFGKKHAEVNIETDELAGQAFYIVPGHGGPDPGAVAKNVNGKFDVCEDEYAYDVSLRLAKNLLEKGAEVFVIIQDKNDGIRDEEFLDGDTDEVCMGGQEIPLNQKKRLRQGMKKVNSLYHKNHKKFTKHWMVSIHVDSRPSEDRQDVFFTTRLTQRQVNKRLSIFKKFSMKNMKHKTENIMEVSAQDHYMS